jgi:hypothetical protein
MRFINRKPNGCFARARRSLRAGSLSCRVLIAALLFPQMSVAESVWPGAQWAQADPASVGLDQGAIEALSAEIEAGPAIRVGLRRAAQGVQLSQPSALGLFRCGGLPVPRQLRIAQFAISIQKRDVGVDWYCD